MSHKNPKSVKKEQIGKIKKAKVSREVQDKSAIEISIKRKRNCPTESLVG